MPRTSAGRPWRFHSRISTGFPMTCKLSGPLMRLETFRKGQRIRECIPESTGEKIPHDRVAPTRHTPRCHVWIWCTSRKSKVSPDGIWRFLSSWMDSFVSRKPVSSISTLQTWLAHLYKYVWNVAFSLHRGSWSHASTISFRYVPVNGLIAGHSLFEVNFQMNVEEDW